MVIGVEDAEPLADEPAGLTPLAGALLPVVLLPVLRLHVAAVLLWRRASVAVRRNHEVLAHVAPPDAPQHVLPRRYAGDLGAVGQLLIDQIGAARHLEGVEREFERPICTCLRIGSIPHRNPWLRRRPDVRPPRPVDLRWR